MQGYNIVLISYNFIFDSLGGLPEDYDVHAMVTITNDVIYLDSIMKPSYNNKCRCNIEKERSTENEDNSMATLQQLQKCALNGQRITGSFPMPHSLNP
ncbi:hypothetical protein GWI33_008152 [Rhynchophorus ferrugineus]|uniref:Uncharacterized protein n=1 Tax=Rhynchophorus ferrugineus TaxID=354439 RepID=A0A834IDA5_RHYFE|nr:hypothetical protein GWI33_008152 [Rhynchophorus ferrugineus]